MPEPGCPLSSSGTRVRPLTAPRPGLQRAIPGLGCGYPLFPGTSPPAVSVCKWGRCPLAGAVFSMIRDYAQSRLILCSCLPGVAGGILAPLQLPRDRPWGQPGVTGVPPDPLPVAGPPWPVSSPQESRRGHGGCTSSQTSAPSPELSGGGGLSSITSLTPAPRSPFAQHATWGEEGLLRSVGLDVGGSPSEGQERPAHSWAVTGLVWPQLSHLQNGRGGCFLNFRLCNVCCDPRFLFT